VVRGNLPVNIASPAAGDKMARWTSGLFFILGFMLACADGASAQIVERSGANFHVPVCPGPPSPGIARCHAHVVTDSLGNELANRFAPSTGRNVRKNGGPNAEPVGYGPPSLIQAYNPAAAASYPNLGSSATTIAVVEAKGYRNAEADLAVYRAAFGLPPCTSANGCFVKYNQNGRTRFFPLQNLGWAQETALDLDMASAMCPNCKLMLVEAKSAGYADLAQAENVAASKGANVISNSYGGSEQGSQLFAAAYDHPGVTIVASTGDKGYSQNPQFPATLPSVTAVGGTSLYPDNNARGWTELAWAEGGSGCSSVYPKPSWQAFITQCPNRMEADISAVADPNTGVAVYGPYRFNNTGWLVFGGTSVSAPLIAGLYAATGDPAGPAALYGGTADLNDVISGSNGQCGIRFFCTAGPGYDGPTGLGTPNGLGAF
jgi:subtilase family serine protease